MKDPGIDYVYIALEGNEYVVKDKQNIFWFLKIIYGKKIQPKKID